MFITEGTKQAKYSKKFEDTHNQRYYTQVVNAVNKKDADVKVVLCQVQEEIDEKWVLAVEKALPAIENIFATRIAKTFCILYRRFSGFKSTYRKSKKAFECRKNNFCQRRRSVEIDKKVCRTLFDSRTRTRR